MELSITQFQACQEANGQFCSTPFQPLANPPSCSSFICEELPPRYETAAPPHLTSTQLQLWM